MTVVDASVWLSHFLGSDAHHRATSRWLGGQISDGRPLFAPAIVLAEVAGVMAREADSEEAGLTARDFILSLRTVTIVDIDARLGHLASNIAASARLKGMDAIYAALARDLAMPLVTWDGEQIRRAGGVAPD